MCRYKVSADKTFPANIKFTMSLDQIPFTDEIQETNTNFYTELSDNYTSEFNENLSNFQISIGLENPTKSKPVILEEFIGKHLDLSYLQELFDNCYGDMKYHYRYQPEAMMKTTIIKYIKRFKSHQESMNRLKTHPIEAKKIGYKIKNNGLIDVPDRKTLWYWENIRIHEELLKEALNLSIIELRKQLEKHNIILGRRIGIDSTPLSALTGDKDAKYNKHYNIKGYKIHGATDLDTNIPLAIVVTPANTHDHVIFKELIQQLHQNGIKFKKIYTDSAYDSFEHFALIHLKHNAQFITSFKGNAKINEKGTKQGLKKEYNRLRHQEDYQPPDKITFEQQLHYLMKHRKYIPVGSHYRNQLIENRENQNIENKKNIRNAHEGFHGFIKEHLYLEKNLKCKGIKNIHRYVYLKYLAIISLAITRAQNGIAENLTQIAYFE